MVVIPSNCSKLKLFATRDTEFHSVGSVQAEAGKEMDWLLNLLILRSFSMCTFMILSFLGLLP